MPVFSLPGAYGIGTLGAEARNFIDFLSASGQQWWQILPLGRVASDASPYMPDSSYAGNPLLIDLDDLADRGLLTKKELHSAESSNPDRICYPEIFRSRAVLLRKAFRRSAGRPDPEAPELPWLPDYARFAALRQKYGPDPHSWPADAKPDAAEEGYQTFLQNTFYRQWFALRAYAASKGVGIIGDIPFYLSANSFEAWFHPELFQLDRDGRPIWISGVPPDAFSADGQTWNQPLYDWSGNRSEVWDFWLRRIRWCGRLYDALRIDHFRAFHSYWAIPVTAVSAKEGHWMPGPGMPFLDRLCKEVPDLRLIAEDLGDISDDAKKFLAGCGVPGMKVLTFAFDPNDDSAYLPHNCSRNYVIYTSYHDTPTFVQWLSEADTSARIFCMDYLRLRFEEGYGWGAIANAWETPCEIAMTTMQDILGLGADARINLPGTVSTDNWSWRVRREALNRNVSAHLLYLTGLYRRLPKKDKK